jgi:pyruvate formate lyase activating enzyme
VDGTLVAETYGLISSLAVDPIEKKPVFHYAPGSSVLSVGSIGCSMRCGHCQNWQISRANLDEGAAALRELAPEDLVRTAASYQCPGVAFTYNEPVIWLEYVIDCSRAAHEAGLFTVMVTNGYITREALDLLGGLIDVWRVDLKGIRDETYRTLCHVQAVSPVLEAAERAKNHWGMHVEVVTNVVPTINDSAEDLRDIARWICENLGEQTPWHVTRFFPYLEYADLSPTPLATLRMARTIGQEAGLHFVFLGNVEEPGGEDTVCPGCGATAIRRSGYTVGAQHVRDGGCGRCGHALGIVD